MTLKSISSLQKRRMQPQELWHDIARPQVWKSTYVIHSFTPFDRPTQPFVCPCAFTVWSKKCDLQSLHHLRNGHFSNVCCRLYHHWPALLLAGPDKSQALAHLQMGPSPPIRGVHGDLPGRLCHVCAR